MDEKDRIPYRQIHLDFHTSKYIEGIADQFDGEEFAQTLLDAHVNSINLFTKCHHGMFYYPTKIGTMHPHLKIDLFGEQMKTCRAHGIRAIAYTCVAWNEDWADRHPEWMVVDHCGVLGNRDPFSNARTTWRSLCINNPDYKSLLKQEYQEVYDLYHPDGFWIDIVLGKTCICPHCIAEMREMGLDPQKIEDVRYHDAYVEIKHCREFYQYLKEMDPALELYFNSHPYQLDNNKDPEISTVEKRNYFSFLDIESLPSEEWGYAHFPVAVNYISHFDQEYTMMNGKFHGSWGDFGSLRNIEAMEYEAFRAIANGAKVCTGDQLHPCGRLDPVVYKRIGRIFASIEEKEPWLHGSRKLTEVAVMIPSSPLETNPQLGNLVEEGCYRILSELHIPFDFIHAGESLDGYRLVILPDRVGLTESMAERLNVYIQEGGRLLITGKSGLMEQKDEFGLKGMGCRYEGPSSFDVRYIRLTNDCWRALPPIDHVLYTKGEAVTLTDGTALAEIVEPYFNRSYDRFCSHRQTPPKLQSSGEAAIVEGRGILYCSSPLFTDYAKNGAHIYKEIIQVCIDKLYPVPLLKTDLPSITEVMLRRQRERLVLHLINYVIQKKCKLLDTIEERYTVENRTVFVRMDSRPSAVREVPKGAELPFSWAGGYLEIPIARAQGHTMIEVVP